MNQIFRITVGQETLNGRLPAVRVACGFSCRFHIRGVGNSEGTLPPKIWIGSGEETLYWVGVWSDTVGAWVIKVGADATAEIRTDLKYALTAFDAEGVQYGIGDGAFVVYNTISDGTGATGEPGEDPGTTQGERLAAIEAWIASFADLAMFDPETAKDFELREQVRSITNLLRATP